MCRLAAFPPGYPKEAAHYLMDDMVKGNRDGSGVAYIKDGKFWTVRHPGPMVEIKDPADAFFGHMPCDSWTIAHVRFATHGVKAKRNTHPFFFNRFAVVHNGVYSDYNVLRTLMKDKVTWTSETDSEVAGWIFDKLGPVAFLNTMGYAGVYLGLHKKGGLWAVNTSSGGDLKVVETEHGALLASELPFVLPDKRLQRGCWHFDKKGILKNSWTEKAAEPVTHSYQTSSPSYRGQSENYRGGRPVTSCGGELFTGDGYHKDKKILSYTEEEFDALTQEEFNNLSNDDIQAYMERNYGGLSD